jgi:hypothetical protein
MDRSFASLLCLGIMAACTPTSADAYEVRVRFVRWNGAVWEPLCDDTLFATPGSSHRIRIEAGVFDDGAGVAPAGGFVGWNTGDLVTTGGTNSRTPGCLPPFRFAPSHPFCPCFPFAGCPDPFTSLTGLDITIGTQAPPWNCSPPPGGAPLPAPAPIVRGRNAYMQLFEFTTVVGAGGYSITASGNIISATEWRVVGAPIPPDCGLAADPSDDIPGFITYAPSVTPPVAFTRSMQVTTTLPADCLADGVPDVCQDAFTERLYSLTGASTGTPWSWCVNSSLFPPVCNPAVPGVPAGQPAMAVATVFASSINATPCPDTQLVAEAFNLLGTTYLVVGVASRLTGDTPFNLCVGPAGGPAGCCPAAAFSECAFNPIMRRIPTSGLDCNGNGHDDTIDIVSGRSSDNNNDGVPDDCQGNACPADFNRDNILNSQDFFDFLVAFFANQPAADFNRDNTINSQDFFDYVSAFFNGC